MNTKPVVLLVSLLSLFALYYFWPDGRSKATSEDLKFFAVAERSIDDSNRWIDLDAAYTRTSTGNIPYVADDVYAMDFHYESRDYLMYVARKSLPTYQRETQYALSVVPSREATYECYLDLCITDFDGAIVHEVQAGSGRLSRLYKSLRSMPVPPGI